MIHLDKIVQLIADVATPSTISNGNAIVQTLITVLGGGLLTLIGTIIVSRAGKKVPVEDAKNPIIIANDDDDEYRQVLRENAALRLFLGLRGYDPDKIIRGTERDDETKA